MGKRAFAASAFFLLVSCGGDGGGGSPAPPPTPPVNRAPAFTSAATVSTPENTFAAYQAIATDPDGNALTFSIAGGPDAARFAIMPAGALTFVAAPDFEAPADADRNNVYLVRLRVSDGALFADLDVAITVTDVAGESLVVRHVGASFREALYVAPVPGDTRVFVLEKGGRILLLDPATSTSTTFMTVAGTISTDGERGLLGMAAAPDYAASGVFYLFVTAPSGDIEVRRYTRRNANEGDPASGDVILTIGHRQASNHNGGWLGFGPDGLLYVATGDGGGSFDKLTTSQNLNSLLGKILRIDVRTDGFPADPLRDYAIPQDNPAFPGGQSGEIVAYGFRNPFRASFDGANLYIGDVGEGALEEVDLLRPADFGANYGWPFREGTRANRANPPAGLTPPVTEYDHGSGPLQGRSVTGGYVYRGPVRALQGQYLFGDFVTGNLWSLPAAELLPGVTLPSSRYTRRNADFAPDAGSFGNIASFGEDAAKNVYIVDFDGDIFMLRAGG